MSKKKAVEKTKAVALVVPPDANGYRKPIPDGDGNRKIEFVPKDYKDWSIKN